MNNNEKKSKEIAHNLITAQVQDDWWYPRAQEHYEEALMEMANWKDEQYKTAYVVTRSDLHYDEVEKVFFDKSKAEEYCKSFNEDESGYHRDITEIEVSL